MTSHLSKETIKLVHNNNNNNATAATTTLLLFRWLYVMKSF